MSGKSTGPRTRVAGVVVTFFPDAEFPRRLRAVARETSPVFVIDNSAAEDVRCRLRANCAESGASLIEAPENAGLAAALNRGFRAAADAGCDWAIAFDQDSTPAENFAASLMQTAEASAGRAAVVGANWHDEGRPGWISRHLRPHRTLRVTFERVPAATDLEEVTCVIASGSLFQLAAWNALGGFDERLFLDLVDAEYCLRARAAGWRVSVSAAARLAHRRGAKCAVPWAGRTWWPAFMPPARLRYLFRNRILLLRRAAALRAPHWVCFELAYTAKVLAEIALLENDKAAKFAACLRGVRDGIARREGRIDSPP